MSSRLILGNPDDICLCPLYTPCLDHLDVQWFPRDYEMDVPTTRHVCCRRPAAHHYINGVLMPPFPQPVIFELVGQISEHDCYLTTEGHGDRLEGPLASCWVEPRPDYISGTEWAKSARAVRHILDSIPIPWSSVVLLAEGRPPQFQLFHEPPEGETLQNTLPMYRRNGRRRVLRSLADVPFGHAMRFLFTIHYSQNLTIPDAPRIVYAEIVSMARL